MKRNKKLYKNGQFLLVLMLVFVAFSLFSCISSAETEMREITVSHQPCFDSFNTFWAIKQGMMEKNNLKIEMMYFDSGMPQIEALPAKEWVIGPVGIVPALFAVLRMDVYIIAVAHDESGSMSVMARPDSPIFNTKGYNPEYPNIYGDPETVKGMTALATTISTSHYTLARYLDDLGLSESDLKVLNLEQPQAVAAFERGEGDLVGFFSPYSYIGKAKGWKEVANGSDTGAKSLLAIISPRKWADENTDIVVDFLDAYFEAQEDLIRQGPVLADEYKKFLMDYSALEISDDNARGDFEDIIFYTLKEHLENLENGNFEKWTKESADFFYEKGKFTKEDRDKLEELHFGYTDKFMKLVAKKRGIIN
jgi:sulfonate transport system substrate-binding protein